MRTRLTAAVLAAAVLAAGGCTRARTGSLGPAPTAAPVATAPAPADTPAATPSPSGSITIQLWFTRTGKIVPTRRSRPATLATSRLALTELAAGPSPAEAAAGLATAFPASTTFDIAGIADGVATVSFTAGFYAGGRDAARLRQAQVVYTLTQFPTVSKVGFQSDREPVGRPLGRADYADLIPAIVVTAPLIGQRVSSPITVTGTADVFEATVSVRVLDAVGREVTTAFTTATCGTGCRGDYRVTLPYRLAAEQSGVIEVYEVSARDGARVNVVPVPVTLAASRG
jgi:hypothetical protein